MNSGIIECERCKKPIPRERNYCRTCREERERELREKMGLE